jgi:acyl-CoA thioesterase FadM
VCCSGRVTIVCVDARRLRPRAIPQRLMEEINDAV